MFLRFHMCIVIVPCFFVYRGVTCKNVLPHMFYSVANFYLIYKNFIHEVSNSQNFKSNFFNLYSLKNDIQ